jgi:hypothetical protein
MTKQYLEPDETAAQKFLDYLLGPLAQTCFQIFDSREREKRKRPPYASYKSLFEAGPGLATKNNEGYGVYFQVNEADPEKVKDLERGKRGEKGIISRVRAFFVDLDGAPLEPIQKCGLFPHVVTQTRPDRYQCFWKVGVCSLDKFEAVQRALIKKFSGDKACSDLGRVMRLPGFYNVKEVEGCPFLVKVLTKDDKPAVKVDEFVATLKLDLSDERGQQGERVPFTDNFQLWTHPNRHFNLGRLANRLRWIGLPDAFGHEVLSLANQHLCDEAKPQKEIDDWWTWTKSKVVPVPLEENHMYVDKLGGRKETTGAQEISIISAADLAVKDVEGNPWVVEEVLPVGLCALIGDSGVYKSWLVHALGLDVATGGRFLDRFQCEHGKSLYLALEDSEWRLQDRMFKIMGHRNAPKDYFMATQIDPKESSIAQLEKTIMKIPDLRLVMIDTWAHFKDLSADAGKANMYYLDVNELKPMKKLALAFNVCILLVHHTNKSKDAKHFNQAASGSMGFAGTVDTRWWLKSEQDKNNPEIFKRILKVSGKDVAEKAYSITRRTPTWRLVCSGDEENLYAGNNTAGAIIEFLDIHYDKAWKVCDIARRISKTERTVRNVMTELHHEGKVERMPSGGWQLKKVGTLEETQDAIQLEYM